LVTEIYYTEAETEPSI